MRSSKNSHNQVEKGATFVSETAAHVLATAESMLETAKSIIKTGSVLLETAFWIQIVFETVLEAIQGMKRTCKKIC